MSANETTTSSPINQADTTWILISTCLVFIMVPGVGFYYAGVVNKKTHLSALLSSVLAISVVSFQWFLFGYTLTFSQTGSSFIGNFDNVALIDVGNEPHKSAPTIPANTFMIYQCMFSIATASLTFGSAAERTTMPLFIIFVFVWSTLVYDVIAYWTWAPNGWLKALGIIDFAGGVPVHITAGFSAFAYALATGPRRTINFATQRSSDVAHVYLGTALSWFGWFGFNGGSECATNSRATNAVVVTNLAAIIGGFGWIGVEMIKRRTTRMSLNGFCNGAMAGLVIITPASGFVKPHFSLIFGLIGGVCCCLMVDIKRITKFNYDDSCDVFAVHATGGVLGTILTGIFADNVVVTMSGDPFLPGGWINQHYIQVVYQLVGVVVSAVWSFVVTFIIIQLLGLLPGVKIRLSEKEEAIGSDWIDMGEATYGHDVQVYSDEYIKELKQQCKKESGLSILKGYIKPKQANKITVTSVSTTVEFVNNGYEADDNKETLITETNFNKNAPTTRPFLT